MIVKEKIGNLSSFNDEGRPIDRLPVEWFETCKRIMHKKTGSGKEIILKFLDKSPNLQQDDILYANDQVLIVVEILSCEAIVSFQDLPTRWHMFVMRSVINICHFFSKTTCW